MRPVILDLAIRLDAFPAKFKMVIAVVGNLQFASPISLLLPPHPPLLPLQLPIITQTLQESAIFKTCINQETPALTQTMCSSL